MSPRAKPPFRADHVGSLLRPAALKEARAKFAKGEVDAAALTGEFAEWLWDGDHGYVRIETGREWGCRLSACSK